MNEHGVPTKTVDEVVTLMFQFQDQMEFGEEVDTFSVTVGVHSGTDPAPSDMLYKKGKAFPYYVEHQVQKGVPGVVYDFICSAVTDLGNTYVQSGLLGVIPGSGLAPPFHATYLSTPLYPILHMTDFTCHAEPMGGELRLIMKETMMADAIHMGAWPTGGRMWEPFVSYTLEEYITMVCSPMAGRLWMPLQTTTMVSRITMSATPIIGNMRTALITTLIADQLTVSAAPIGGNLV